MEPLTVAAVALAVAAFGLVSGRAERSFVTAPMVFTGVGLGLGAAEVLDMDLGSSVIHGLAELTLILVLFTDASRIDLSCLRRERAIPMRLLGLGMPLTIGLGALVGKLLFPSLTLTEAALLAAILAPTDAALGQAVVSNPAVPVRIRQSLNVESGLNDGIAVPVVLLLGSMAGAVEQMGDATYWVGLVFLAITFGPLAGWLVGWAGGRLLTEAMTLGWVSPAFQRIAALAFALLAFAGAELVGGNGFIAAFVAGLTIGNTARGVCDCLYEFGEAEGQLFGLLVFLVFGATLVPEAMAHVSLAVVGYAVLSLTVVRMVPVALALVGLGLKPPTLGFLGWFGPRGLASILFVLLIVESGRLEQGALIEAVVVLTVLGSILLHGASAHPAAQRYGAWVREQSAAMPEMDDVQEHPVRIRST